MEFLLRSGAVGTEEMTQLEVNNFRVLRARNAAHGIYNILP